MRIPKDNYCAHQVMWDGWVDIERPRIYIIGHWNYDPDTKKNVYVVSSAEKVELFINGKSQGFGNQSYRFLYIFPDIAWEAGVLKAVGYDANSKAVCEAEKKTTGKPDGVRLTAQTSSDGLLANGADMTLITVEVVDAEGNRCPTALNIIDFSLKGPAEWRGGIAQGPGNYILAKSLPVECGVNRVLIRSTAQAGKIILNADSQGLRTASVEINSKPVKMIDGLSFAMPDANLLCYISRGPTLQGPSFIVSRIPVNIVSATAGANSNRAAMSFDDNELTNWSNDGSLANGWIRYSFERPAKVSEVTLKLDGWRNRSYPIQISIDGKEVFKGNTPQSLGYITILFEPVTGSNMTVQLVGATVTGDAFNISEVAGQKDSSGAVNQSSGAKGSLGIVELEVYEKAAN
jgi:hypothetical protein